MIQAEETTYKSWWKWKLVPKNFGKYGNSSQPLKKIWKSVKIRKSGTSAVKNRHGWFFYYVIIYFWKKAYIKWIFSAIINTKVTKKLKLQWQT